MTQKAKRYSYKKGIHKTTIKFLEQQPLKFAGAICPINVEEQKEKFLKYGKAPQFVLNGNEDEIDSLFAKAKNHIRFDLFGEAQHILNTVKEKYGDGENYLVQQYGEAISKDDATEELMNYLKENNLDGAMSIVWCADLQSTARMMWVGPSAKVNKPESRTFSFWIRYNKENHYISLPGIRCLADHEIGTHFFRSFNDGLQPWYSDRKRFGLRGMNSLEHLKAEEGLAAINTIINAKEKYLWGPAMLYYTSCKAAEMSFKQLYDHLAMYVSSPERRWRYCTRVKRGLVDPNDIGGFGKDQCYFEGAVEILRNLENIDFSVFISGKICLDEIQRCKRLARKDTIKVPSFMRNEKLYKKKLQNIAALNGIHMEHPKKNPPVAYLQKLKRGRRVGPMDGKVRRRKKCRKSSAHDDENTPFSASSSSYSSSLASIRSDIETNQKNVTSQSNASSRLHVNACNVVNTPNHTLLHNSEKGALHRAETVPFKFFNVSKTEQDVAVTEQIVRLASAGSPRKVDITQVCDKPVIAYEKPQVTLAFCESVNNLSDNNKSLIHATSEINESNNTSTLFTPVESMKTSTGSEMSLSQLSTQSAEIWKDIASKADSRSNRSNSISLDEKSFNLGSEFLSTRSYVCTPYPDKVSMDSSVTTLSTEESSLPKVKSEKDLKTKEITTLGEILSSAAMTEKHPINEAKQPIPKTTTTSTNIFDTVLSKYSLSPLQDKISPTKYTELHQDCDSNMNEKDHDEIEPSVNYLKDPLPPISARGDNANQDNLHKELNGIGINQTPNTIDRGEVIQGLMSKIDADFAYNHSVSLFHSKLACKSNLRPLKHLPSASSFQYISRNIDRCPSLTSSGKQFDRLIYFDDGSEDSNDDY